MLSAGKVDMQAWRSIQAAMPGQLNQVAEAMLGAGKNSNDLYEAMKNGSISFDDFNKKVIELNQNGFGKYASFAQQAKDATQGIGTAMEAGSENPEPDGNTIRRTRTIKAVGMSVEQLDRFMSQRFTTVNRVENRPQTGQPNRGRRNNGL